MEEINCITQLENHVGVTYETKYLIMPTSRETILILGMEFLIRYKGKIDIEGVVLTLGKQEYELKNYIRKPGEYPFRKNNSLYGERSNITGNKRNY